MSETTKTLSEWITIDQRERRQRRELLRELAEYQKTHPPLMAAFRPKAVTAPTVPPKVDMRPPAELPDNPTLEDVAKQLGVSVEQFQQATGGMSLDRLMQLLGVEDAEQLVEMLDAVIRNQPRGLNRFERVRVAVAKVRLYGRNCAKLMTIERARAARAAALKKHRAAFKRR